MKYIADTIARDVRGTVYSFMCDLGAVSKYNLRRYHPLSHPQGHATSSLLYTMRETIKYSLWDAPKQRPGHKHSIREIV